MLAVNCASSPLKFRLSETSLGHLPIDKWLAWGVVVGVGGRRTLDFAAVHDTTMRATAEVADHGAAVSRGSGGLVNMGLWRT